MMKKTILSLIFISFFLMAPSKGYGISITNINTNMTYGINCTLEDFEQELKQNWSSPSNHNLTLQETQTKTNSLECIISEPAQTIIQFNIPNAYQDFRNKRLLSFNIKSKSPKTSIRIGLKEKSGELWYSKQFIPITENTFKTLNYQLYQYLYIVDSEHTKDNHLDFSSIESLFFYISSAESTIVHLDQLVLHGYFPVKNLEDKHLTTQSNNNAKHITAFSGIDTTPPQISELLIDEKPILENDYVTALPEISASIIESDSGLTTWNISVINTETNSIATQFIQNHQSATGNPIIITYNVTTALTDGQYLVQCEAFDNIGLSSVLQTPTFNVVSSFRIIDALNGPNPFNPNQEITHIQYQLTKSAEVTIHIYSISGERLWQRTCYEGDPNGGSCGFNSVEWNGFNDFGEIVANGPYVAYIIAKSDGDIASAKIKMLVLK